MCGIIGILSQKKRELVSDAIQSLSDLEYRGYDSAGVAVRSAGGIVIHKCLGAASENLRTVDVRKKMQKSDDGVHAVIGHNRWATHGKPSIKNTHPHVDCHKKIAVVHNGVITNHESIRKTLETLGHVFYSDTDTEVIAHAIEETTRHEKNFEKAFVQALQMLQGSYALIVMHVDRPDKLYIAKDESPLNVGITSDSFVVASGTNALIRYTSTFISLADKEYAVLKAQKNNLTHHVFKYRNGTVVPVRKKTKIIENASTNDFETGEYATHTLKEIFEQPTGIGTTVLGRYDVNKTATLFNELEKYRAKLSSIKHIIFIGCGTAFNAGRLGKELIEKLTDINVQCDISSEFSIKHHNLDKAETLVVAISQSGETADTLRAIADAKIKGYAVCGIINTIGSAMADITDFNIYTRVGQETGVASTKAFTGQVAILYLLSLYLAQQRTLTTPNLKKYLNELQSLPDSMNTALTLADAVEKTAEKYNSIKTITFVGRGVHVPIAHEAALKFKELTYIEAGSYPSGELKHGPIAVIDRDSLTVVIMPQDELCNASQSTVEQIKSRGGSVLVITDTSARRSAFIKKADDVIYIPHLKEGMYYPLIEIIPLQLFAYFFAKQLGLDIDKPRNLAKSVTVE